MDLRRWGAASMAAMGPAPWPSSTRSRWVWMRTHPGWVRTAPCREQNLPKLLVLLRLSILPMLRRRAARTQIRGACSALGPTLSHNHTLFTIFVSFAVSDPVSMRLPIPGSVEYHSFCLWLSCPVAVDPLSVHISNLHTINSPRLGSRSGYGGRSLESVGGSWGRRSNNLNLRPKNSISRRTDAESLRVSCMVRGRQREGEREE